MEHKITWRCEQRGCALNPESPTHHKQFYTGLVHHGSRPLIHIVHTGLHFISPNFCTSWKVESVLLLFFLSFFSTFPPFECLLWKVFFKLYDWEYSRSMQMKHSCSFSVTEAQAGVKFTFSQGKKRSCGKDKLTQYLDTTCWECGVNLETGVSLWMLCIKWSTCPWYVLLCDCLFSF